jgi:hypothetical protein
VKLDGDRAQDLNAISRQGLTDEVAGVANLGKEPLMLAGKSLARERDKMTGRAGDASKWSVKVEDIGNYSVCAFHHGRIDSKRDARKPECQHSDMTHYHFRYTRIRS